MYGTTYIVFVIILGLNLFTSRCLLFFYLIISHDKGRARASPLLNSVTGRLCKWCFSLQIYCFYYVVILVTSYVIDIPLFKKCSGFLHPVISPSHFLPIPFKHAHFMLTLVLLKFYSIP